VICSMRTRTGSPAFNIGRLVGCWARRPAVRLRLF